MTAKEIKIGEILIAKGFLTNEKLDEALSEQKKTGEFLGKVLLRKGYVSEEQLTVALSEQFDMPKVPARHFYIDWKFTMRFTPALVLEHECFPIRKSETVSFFALANPLDGEAMVQAEQETGTGRAKFVLITPSEMRELLERYREYVNIQIRHAL